MKKCFVVSSYGDEYEDRWERVEGVCATNELAEILKNKIEEENCAKSSIPKEIFRDMWEQYLESEEWDERLDEEEILHEMFPEYSIEDIQSAIDTYIGDNSFSGVSIQEINFYE